MENPPDESANSEPSTSTSSTSGLNSILVPNVINSEHIMDGLENKILAELSHEGISVNVQTLVPKYGMSSSDLFVVVNRLQKANFVQVSSSKAETIEFSEDGNAVLNGTSPEIKIWTLVGEPQSLQTLKDQHTQLFSRGFAAAKAEKMIKIENGLVLRQSSSTPQDKTKEFLQKVKDGLTTASMDKNQKKKLKKLKYACKVKMIKIQMMQRGSEYQSTWSTGGEAHLTQQMIQSESFAKLQFKPYNFNAKGVCPSGHLHPLWKMRSSYRQILLEMGFEEMPTNRWVESAFWNFDALFQPQQHPARDAHDTFFISNPAKTLTLPNIPPADGSHKQSYVERVGEMHSKGGQGSKGWTYDWSEDESRKNIMRTHTTAVSSRMLYQLAYDLKTNTKKKTFTPKKYFSVDRVFRNETLDKTHLAEFHQIEGLIADRNLTLGDLQGVIREFFEKVGLRNNIRFKVAYNPYTEPSMEIFAYHPILKKLVEVGNSGIFRPEMLLPLGVPEDVTVIAWGLGLERPTMIRAGLSNIRDLMGSTVDINFIQNDSFVRFHADAADAAAIEAEAKLATSGETSSIIHERPNRDL